MQRRQQGVVRSALATLIAAGLVMGSAATAHAAEPPALTAAAPTTAPPGATVTLTGTGLAGTTRVTFNGTSAAFAVVDDAQVTATVPASATDGEVAVTTPDGVVGLPFGVDEPPGPVSALTARPGDRAVRLRWVVPAGDVTSVVVRRSEGTTAPATPADGVDVPAPTLTGVDDSGLTNGSTYSYSVWATDAAGSLGPVSVVTTSPAPPASSTLRIGASAAAVTSGAAVTVTGVLAAVGGMPLAGEPVTLLLRPRGSATFGGAAVAVTDAGGGVRFPYRVVAHTDFLLHHAADAFSAEATSAIAGVTARHGLTSWLVTSVVLLGNTSLVEGRVGPAVGGVGVRLERRTASAWQLLMTTSTDARGGFRFAVRPANGGEQVLRVVTTGDSAHLAATGAALRLVALARTLSTGMSGADVLAVERRLTDLRYDVGPASGVYDYDTRLAVMAFQKVQGLPRTGVADAVTRARLGMPVAPQLRRVVRGLSVEIDLTKQVLLYARDGVVQRILPVSSGNNELYTVDGITSRAVTPVGSFRVQRKIDGVRVSRLGQLYQPAYFIGGYAVHGSPSVPGHPASHGCIRITIPAMRRLFSLLPVGTPVLIYRG